MMTKPLEQVETHADLPRIDVRDIFNFLPSKSPGVSKYQASLPLGTHLDALLINKESDVLVVALHGATNRQSKELPRFEWMRTLRETEFSSLYFSDPCLELDETLSLAWYTGWKDFDLYPVLADWALRSAEAIGATKILFVGSSGGGLAALQISTYVPGSMALPFSCQTSISAYKVSGTKYGAQRSYLRVVMPHLTPTESLESIGSEIDWSEPLGSRLSAVTRYSEEQRNYVYYVQNKRDYSHVEQHYKPFRKVVEGNLNINRVKFVNYSGPENHNPPTQEVFKSALHNAVKWIRELNQS